jgi:hypothetical protein
MEFDQEEEEEEFTPTLIRFNPPPSSSTITKSEGEAVTPLETSETLSSREIPETPQWDSFTELEEEHETKPFTPTPSR